MEKDTNSNFFLLIVLASLPLSRTLTAESSTLHLASQPTQTGIL